MEIVYYQMIGTKKNLSRRPNGPDPEERGSGQWRVGCRMKRCFRFPFLEEYRARPGAVAEGMYKPSQKKGFWFKIAAEAKFKPEAYSSLPRILISPPIKILG
jgi:hypothetical protein